MGGARISFWSTTLVLLTVAVYGALFAFLRFSRWGMRMRATGQNPLLAAQRGINLHTIYALAWSLSTLTGALAGILIALDSGITTAMPVIGLKAFPAALVGGLDSLIGALVGAFIVAASEVLLIYYVDPLLSDVVPFLVLIAMLVIRPWGLFGTREELDRVYFDPSNHRRRARAQLLFGGDGITRNGQQPRREPLVGCRPATRDASSLHDVKQRNAALYTTPPARGFRPRSCGSYAARESLPPLENQVTKRGFERLRDQLVDSQRAKEWIAPQSRDQLRVADDQSRLRTSQQLVAGKRNDIDARIEVFDVTNGSWIPNGDRSVAQPLPRSRTAADRAPAPAPPVYQTRVRRVQIPRHENSAGMAR